MKPFWILRRVVKRLIVFVGCGSLLVEYCEVCGRRQPLIWRASSSLWRQLNEGREGGALCPECFDRRAQKAGHCLTWAPYLHGERLVELERWCTQLITVPFDSPEWGQALDMVGTIITEEDTP